MPFLMYILINEKITCYNLLSIYLYIIFRRIYCGSIRDFSRKEINLENKVFTIFETKFKWKDSLENMVMDTA